MAAPSNIVKLNDQSHPSQTIKSLANGVTVQGKIALPKWLGSASVRVTDGIIPIVNAQVNFSLPGSPWPLTTRYTDQNGTAIFSDVQPGNYVLVSASDFAAAVANVAVATGATATLRLKSR